MLIASVPLVASLVVTQTDPGGAEFFTSRFYYAARLIGALLVATVVPLLIDRRVRSSSRTSR
jgi:hypothetical protein